MSSKQINIVYPTHLTGKRGVPTVDQMFMETAINVEGGRYVSSMQKICGPSQLYDSIMMQKKPKKILSQRFIDHTFRQYGFTTDYVPREVKMITLDMHQKETRWRVYWDRFGGTNAGSVRVFRRARYGLTTLVEEVK